MLINDPIQIAIIKEKFATMQTKNDLLDLLNTIKPLLIHSKTKVRPIPLKALTYFANAKLAQKRYTTFTIKKKSGGERSIAAPVKQLKLIQKCLNTAFNIVFIPSKSAYGFVQGKNVADNAHLHAARHYVFNTDLKNFFPSVDFRRVKTILQLEPFKLNDDLAFLIANLCCYEGKLPQGAPTSPTLTNAICQKLDRKLSGLAKRFGAVYTRYADDITFSSMHSIYSKDGEFMQELHRIIENEKFTINEAKTRLQRSAYRQEVTGIIVNETPNLSRQYIAKIRAMLHNWEKQGIEKASEIFLSAYISDKGHVKKGKPDFINVLRGKLDYMKMVRGENDLLYKKYAQQFLTLYHEYLYGKVDLKKILDIWEAQGIEKAMEVFYETKAS